MPLDTRHKDWNWTVCSGHDGDSCSTEGARMAILMDIRDELRAIRRIVTCPNFLSLPRQIERIRQNTTKRKRRKV